MKTPSTPDRVTRSSVALRAPDAIAPELTAQRQFYPNLEALRGLAALVVVLHHLPFPGRIAHSVLAVQSWLFVDFFFVLSGFVIALVHFNQPSGAIAACRFLIRRLFRLYPLHLATLSFVAAMFAIRLALDPTVGPRIGVNDRFPLLLAANLLLVQSWGFSGNGTLNVPSWSISAEWLAYLVSALIVAMISDIRWRLAALLMIGGASRAILVLHNHATLDGDLTFRALRCLYAFSLGALVWRIARPIDRPLRAMVVQLVSLAAIAGIMLGALRTTQLTLLFPPAAALLVWAAAGDDGSPLRQLLGSPPARWLGERSYSIYLVHIPLFMVLAFAAKQAPWTDRLQRSGDALGVADMLSVLAIALVAVAAVTYRWIEIPWRERGRRLSEALIDGPQTAGRARR